MKIQDIIQEFIPCEVCGNSDVDNFYFHVFVHWGHEPFVKCCECEEEYYSGRAKKILGGIEKERVVKRPRLQVTIRPEEDCEMWESAKRVTGKIPLE